MVKRLPTMREARVQSLGREDLWEKDMAIHSSILAWKIPWMEEPGRLQSMGPRRVGHDWATSLSFSMETYKSQSCWWWELPILSTQFFYKPKTALSSVQSLSRVRLFVTPWIAAHQASLSITNFRSSLRFMSIESVMPSSHLILGRPLLLLPPIPPSIKVFSNESTLHMRWPKYWSFSFSAIYVCLFF